MTPTELRQPLEKEHPTGRGPADIVSLSAEYLLVAHGKRRKAWAWADVQRVSLQTRKLWFPLLAGGIVASLCLVALFTTYKYPWWLLSGATLGSIAAYYGYLPRPTLVIEEAKHHTDFILREPNPKLPAVIGLANRLALRYPLPAGPLWLPLTAHRPVPQSIQFNESQRLFWPEEVPTGVYGLRLTVFGNLNQLQFSVGANKKLVAYVRGTITMGPEAELAIKE